MSDTVETSQGAAARQSAGVASPNERPIIFSGPMVRAILDGRKTQTRRVVKPQPSVSSTEAFCGADRIWRFAHQTLRGPVSHEADDVRCSYGVPGDHLWVRERWMHSFVGSNVDACHYLADAGTDRWRQASSEQHALDSWKGCWKSSMFMPRWASRITLEVTGVRMERLQQIAVDDVLAEGLDVSAASALAVTGAASYTTVPEHWISGDDESLSYCRPCGENKVAALRAERPTEEFQLDGGWGIDGDSQAFCESCNCALENTFTNCACEEELDHFEREGFDVRNPGDCYVLDRLLMAVPWDGAEHSPALRRLAYHALWDSINAKRGHPWASNPWVWVVEFLTRGAAAHSNEHRSNERKAVAVRVEAHPGQTPKAGEGL